LASGRQYGNALLGVRQQEEGADCKFAASKSCEGAPYHLYSAATAPPATPLETGNKISDKVNCSLPP